MLSINEIKETLGIPTMPDQEAKEIRDALHDFSELALEFLQNTENKDRLEKYKTLS